MALKVKAVAPAVRPTTPAAEVVVATTRDLATSNDIIDPHGRHLSRGASDKTSDALLLYRSNKRVFAK